VSQCIALVNLMTGWSARCAYESLGDDRCFYHEKCFTGLMESKTMVPRLTQAEADARALKQMAAEWDVPLDWAKEMARVARGGHSARGPVPILDREGVK
jgi:hypothetical protein